MSTPLSYEIHRHRLDNGLRLVVSPDPWTPVVAVNVWYDVGSAHESPGRTGFAHLFEHLMFAGSAQTGPGEHLGALQSLGGEVNATTSFDRTNYFETVPAGAAELALWYEAARLGSLLEAVDQAVLDTEREVVKEEKRQRYDNVPYGDAFTRLAELVFGPDHPYGHLPIGSMADLDAASLDDVRAFFRRHYLPANAVLSLAGAISVDEAVRWTEDYFGGLGRGEAPAAPAVPALPPLARPVHAEAFGPVPHDAVYLAWRVPPFGQADHEAVGLALGVLADGLTARLHADLVRSELADAVSGSDLDLVRGNSLAVLSATVRDGVDAARVEAAAVATLERFAAEGPTPAELRRATARATRDWLAALASLDSRADALSEAVLVYDDPGRINSWLDEIAGFGVEAVQAAAAAYLAPSGRTSLVYHKERP
ncbi:MAG: insulinase family protein [Propionibacteriaceae bacterium]|nr:insulinase family protein [Propionibacteriaceae bacterium]